MKKPNRRGRPPGSKSASSVAKPGTSVANMELSHLRDQGRLKVLSATDAQALQGFQTLARSEGVLCALESAHAIAALPSVSGGLIVVNLSGRGDKDLATILEALK